MSILDETSPILREKFKLDFDKYMFTNVHCSLRNVFEFDWQIKIRYFIVKIRVE